jgi:hypothetical protein
MPEIAAVRPIMPKSVLALTILSPLFHCSIFVFSIEVEMKKGFYDGVRLSCAPKKGQDK